MTQSFTNQSPENLEASPPPETQLSPKSVAWSPDTYGGANGDSPVDRILPNEHSIPVKGPNSAPYQASEIGSSDRNLSSNGPTISPQHSLGRSIRDSRFIPTDKTLHPFLPRDKLEELLTEERIIQTLGTEGGFSPERQRVIAQEIISPLNFDPQFQPHLHSRREILAILSLIKKVSTIEEFIEDGLFDYHLPFEYVSKPDPLDRGRHRRVMNTCDLEGDPREISIFYQWSDHEAEAFEDQQWKIHVPVFAGYPQPIERPTHYTLAHKAIAPWIRKTEVGRGGFSAVDKVEVHAAHVIRSDKPRQKTLFAIKKLDSWEQDEFSREVSALNRFAEKEAPHLIQLLWTFSLGPIYHLVFPCADGNLLELWQSNEFKSPLAGRLDHETALWFSRQCLGIVEGLDMIHQCINDHDPHDPQHGRHGDLKPENILWFRDSKTNELGYSLGTLKISDFGMTGFHRTQTKSHIDVNGIGCSRTYRPPECEVRPEVSQSYDIWCLACVLLEFTTWYLKGWVAVDSFSESRKLEHRNSRMREDTFFNHFQKADTFSAVAKRSVAEEVTSLYEHPNTSDFTMDLVQFLETSLLRMHPEYRKNCSDAVMQLGEFFDKCCKEPDYCLGRTKEPPTRRNTDLSHLEPVDLPRPSHNGGWFPSDDGPFSRRGSGSSRDRLPQGRTSSPVGDPVPEEPDADIDGRIQDSGVDAGIQRSSTPVRHLDTSIHTSPGHISVPVEDTGNTEETNEATVASTAAPETGSQGSEQILHLSEDDAEEAGPVTSPGPRSDFEKMKMGFYKYFCCGR